MKLNGELTKEQKEFMLFKFYSNFSSMYTDFQVSEHFLDTYKPTLEFLQIKKLAALVNQDWIVVNKCYKKYEVEFADAYNFILEKWVNLFLELKFENTLEITSFFTYLMWSGFFSSNGEYCYDNSNRANIDGWYALDVISGHGVCLNESSMLKDFLLKLGIDAALMINYAKAGKVTGAAPKYCSFRKMTPIKQPSRIKYFFNKKWIERAKEMGNHTVVLTRDDVSDKLMIVDPTNLVLANIKSSKEAVGVNGKVKYKLNPLHSHALARSEQEYRLLSRLFEEQNFSADFTPVQYDLAWTHAYLIFRNNMSAIYDCYNETLPAIEKITKRLEKYRKK